MKTKSTVLASVLAIGLSALAGSAQAATMVAGWDFSQYFGSGFLTIDAANPASSLTANYSDLDPTFGAGAESAAFGTLYYDGTNGSTNVTIDFSGTEAIVPITGSLASNENAPSGGALPFGSAAAFPILSNEGQAFTEVLMMRANSAVDVVFSADLSSLSGTSGSNWQIAFGGITEGGTSDVTIEVSTDGQNFNLVSTKTLTTVDSPFSQALGAALDGATNLFVRLGFNPTTGQLPIIDNVSIMADLVTVPEPGTALLGLAGLAGLAIFGRRRAA